MYIHVYVCMYIQVSGNRTCSLKESEPEQISDAESKIKLEGWTRDGVGGMGEG